MLRPLLFALALLTAPPVTAADIDDSDKAEIAERVALLGAAIAGPDFSGLSEVVPPRILDHIAGLYGIGVEDLKSTMAEEMAEAMEIATIEDFSTEVAQSVYLETADGTPYALIPTRTVVTVKDAGTFEALSQTLAIEDDGTWYLIRVDEIAQIEILRTVYPSFAETEFPAHELKILE